MRRLSHVFGGLVIGIPVLVYLYVMYSTSRYTAENGVGPEGKGYFDLAVLGLRTMLALALLAAIAAVIAYTSDRGEKFGWRRVELATLCAMAPAIVLLTRALLGTWPATSLVLVGI
jgi:hypothetical protein